MKITRLFTGKDNLSHFAEDEIPAENILPLGNYSKLFPVKGLMFRDFKSGAEYHWHNAPQSQYIVYLDGEVEVEASNGEKKVFRNGDILFANDLTGKGHITRTITDGKSLVITTEE